ncbi:hypothetical protein LguiB_004389 [Lonicera macranthoides]
MARLMFYLQYNSVFVYIYVLIKKFDLGSIEPVYYEAKLICVYIVQYAHSQ